MQALSLQTNRRKLFVCLINSRTPSKSASTSSARTGGFGIEFLGIDNCWLGGKPWETGSDRVYGGCLANIALLALRP
ncbi:hypothetical protein EUZ85_18430 [Hahella sp. KA22]|nr:hypothetical protein ENC22_15855 [Hahella sp. KA22]QAY55965.1 hypothetical protein EUZ85_18430 [Hahella sp. KA22]